ncbi:MAG: response regulator [Omnitrophica bacterium]|nr:response regulator [Candidatus Omnitrophota bacterium]
MDARVTKQYYTTFEVSRFCNVYPSTVINWINEDKLPAFTTPGGHRRVKKDDLVRLMKKNNMPLPDDLLKEGKVRILTIDDNAKITKVIKTILEAEQDFEVMTAKSGFEAGLVIARWLPDIILLDFLMPEMDGFEVCRWVKQDEKTKDIPIIAVTVLRDEKKIKKMYTNGVVDYLSKPFKSQELIEKVRTHINACDMHVGSYG